MIMGVCGCVLVVEHRLGGAGGGETLRNESRREPCEPDGDRLRPAKLLADIGLVCACVSP